MQEKECEHEWDDSEDIDIFTGRIELTSEFVMIEVKCCKCGKKGVADADIKWKPIYWDILD